MSKTPRTDSQINGKGTLKLGGDPLKYAMVESEFARKLERELAAAQKKIESLRGEVEKAYNEGCHNTSVYWTNSRAKLVSEGFE